MKETRVMIIGHSGIGKTDALKKILASNEIIVVDNKEFKELGKNQKDLNPEYVKLVNENFWDLIKPLFDY